MRFHSTCALCVIGALSLTSGVASAAALRHEHFNGGTGNFTTALGTTLNGNNIAFSNTNQAGGAASGELGGTFNWLGYAYVADTDLGGTIGFNEPLVIQAKGVMFNTGDSNDEAITLGYFNATGNANDIDRGKIMAGVAFTDGPRAMLFLGGNRSDPVATLSMDTPFDIDLAVTYDSGDGTATIAGTLGGTPVSYNRGVNPSTAWNAFGVGQAYLREAQDVSRSMGAYFDDITYSAVTSVPEPASAMLLGLGAVMALPRRRRR